jgi:hypothetical protein
MFWWRSKNFPLDIPCLTISPPKIESWLMEGLLKSWVHYFLLANDYSDLGKILEWCRNNDDKCKEIVENANNFMKQFEDVRVESEIFNIIKEYYKKTLVTYVYFETKQSINNLDFFIKNGIYDKNDVVYNIIIKGGKCSVIIPNYKNVNIFKTNNEGYDFAGYSNSINNININKFEYFIFINDTVIGPFLPRYIKKNNWYNMFTNLLSNEIKLVGSTINKSSIYIDKNTYVPKHIQSMSFATDIIGLKLLIKNKILNERNNIKIFKNEGKKAFILKFEVNMSKIIMDNGYNIASFNQSENNKIDLYHDDIHFENKYFGITLNPIEIMFIKNSSNRINNKELTNYVNWNNF